MDAARFRVAVEREREGIADPDGDDVLRFVAGDKAGIDERLTRGDAVLRARGVTLGDCSDLRVGILDISDRCVAVDLSLGAGESLAVRDEEEVARDRG